MKPRRAIAVMVSRFPLVTETFILRELIELERQGQPVLLVPMLRETPPVVHDEAKPWVDRALYTPYLSAAILAANLRTLRNQPAGYLALLVRLIAGSLRSPGFLLRTVAIFPKSVYLAEQLQAQGIRHVHAHFATHPATMALIVSTLTNISFSITAHAHDIFVNRTLLGAKLRRASLVRAISKFNRDFLSTRYPRAAAKIQVIHVGINPNQYEASPRLRVSASLRLILCVAALKPYKGLPVLIEACEQLAGEGIEFHCEIIGDGPLRPQIEQLIRTKNLADRIRLLGNVPQHEVAERLGRATVVVLSSIVASDGQMEGIPVALMEAMAAQRPVVASSLSGVPELVEHGRSGLLVEPGNSGELAAAIRQILEAPQRAADLGRRGQQKIREEFVLTSTVEQLLQKIDEVNPPAEISPDELRLLDGFFTGPIGVRRTDEREDSRVVEVLAGGRELIVKAQKSRAGESRPALERARYEYQLLERLTSHFAMTPRFGVPAVLYRDGAAIVMERARGTALDRLIRESRHTPEVLIPTFRSAGQWLRSFHASVWETEHGRRSLIHGDFWPGNIFIGDGRVEVIDFEGARPGEPYQDVADFLVESELFFSRPYLRRHIPRLRDAFLDGYLANDRLDAPALSRCRLAKLRSLSERARSRWRRLTIHTLLDEEANRA